MNPTASITLRHINKWEARALKLTEQVEKATADHPDIAIRTGGTKLAEVVGEWLDELHEMREAGDENLLERFKSFKIRVTLAERQVATWPMPAKAKRKRRRKKAA